MVETRIAPRVRVNKAAIIEFGGIKIRCTIRDLSITGAALQIQEMAKNPGSIHFVGTQR